MNSRFLFELVKKMTGIFSIKRRMIKKQLDGIKERLPTVVKRDLISETSKTALKAHLIRASLLYRHHELAEAAFYLSKRSVIPALVLARAAFETAALLFYTYDKINGVVSSKTVGSIDEDLIRIMFGERSRQIVNGSNISAINILTVVGKLNKEMDSLGVEGGSIQGIYDNLCEYAHPNFSGTLGAYAEYNEQDPFNVAFGTNRTCPKPDEVLPPLEVSLLILDEYDNKLAKILPEFTNLDESDRSQKSNKQT
jgi:hypothetical protein